MPIDTNFFQFGRQNSVFVLRSTESDVLYDPLVYVCLRARNSTLIV